MIKLFDKFKNMKKMMDNYLDMCSFFYNYTYNKLYILSY